MERLKDLFSNRHLPKVLLIVGIYLLGRMEGEGRFNWGNVIGAAWNQAVALGGEAADSARGVFGM